MSSRSFDKMAVLTLDVKRLSPMTADGKRSAAAVHANGVACTPLDPLSDELRSEVELSKPYQALQTFVADDEGVDIAEKDVIVVDDVEYVVRAVGSWRWDSSTNTLRLIVEDARVI